MKSFKRHIGTVIFFKQCPPNLVETMISLYQLLKNDMTFVMTNSVRDSILKVGNSSQDDKTATISRKATGHPVRF